MTVGELRRLVLLSQQLTENVMSVALCAKDFGAIVRAESDRVAMERVMTTVKGQNEPNPDPASRRIFDACGCGD